MAAVAGCDDSDALDPVYTVPTSVVIDPAAIRDIVPCSDAQGAMRSYVATVTDRTDPEHEITLPSSGPTPCSQRVDFRFVVAGHVYTAVIDGYEQRASELAPVGGEGSGSRHMVEATWGEAEDQAPEVKPRWRIGCEPPRDSDGSLRPVQEGASSPLERCTLDEDRGSTTPTTIEVDPGAALGSLRCAGDGGEISAFDVRPVGSGLPAVLGVACPPAEPVRYSAGLVPGQEYEFRIEATGPGGAWAATCQARAAEGITVAAACTPLSSQGALSIPIGDALAAAGLVCGADGLESYIARIESLASPPVIGPVQSNAVPCDEDARIAPLPPGLYRATLRSASAETDSPPIAACEGEVKPGATTVAACSVAP